MHILLLRLAFSLAGALPLAVQAHHHPSHSGHGDSAQQELDPASVAAPEGVSVSDCWIRALPNRLPAAAYFRIANAGSHDAVLVGAQAEGFGKVMLHTHETRNGMAAMVHVDEVTVPAGGAFDFAPRGHHVMLEQPAIDLEIGATRPLVLWFEGPRALTVDCEVRPPATLQ